MRIAWARLSHVGRVASACAIAAIFGCGSEATSPEDVPPAAAACPPGFMEQGEACSPVGMTAEACPEGFAFDDGLCLPVWLPDCPPGTMALPGEPACHPPSPCTAGKWGDIALDAATQHVDGSYVGNDSDGTATRPWANIAAGISAATNGATVAIARGTYVEALTVSKPLTLWGVCPTETLIEASAAQTIVFRNGSSGSVLRSVGVSGSGIGVIVSGAELTLEAVWSHDAGDVGVVAEGTLGAARVTVRDSLVEGFQRAGIQILGAATSIERSVVRTPAAAGRGSGIWIQASVAGVRAEGHIVDSAIDRVRFVGILASAADVLVERTAVLSPLPTPTEGHGWGLLSQAQIETGERALLTVTQSTVMDAAELGVSVAGADAHFEHVSVSGGVGGEARGVEAEDSNGSRAALTMVDSTVASSEQVGILCGGSDVLLDRVQVRNVRPSLDGTLGRGISLQTNKSTLVPTAATITDSLVRDNLDIGLLVANSTVTLQSSGIYTTGPLARDGSFGDGVSVVTTDAAIPATIDLIGVEVRGNTRAGLAIFGSTANVIDSTFACNGFDLNAETLVSIAPNVADLGGNQCGCDEAVPCKVLSSQLLPPDTL